MAWTNSVREVVKTTILEQDPPNHKIDDGLCLYPPSSTSKDGVFTAWPPLYPALKNGNDIQISLLVFIEQCWLLLAEHFLVCKLKF